MTSHADALLHEIIADPATDGPRLVLADHYEQTGDTDRANFIRAQVRRASLPWWEEQLALDLEERAILARREVEWRAGLPKLDGVTWGSFVRGFVGRAAFATVEAYLAHRATCARATPLDSVMLWWPRVTKPPLLDAAPAIRELTMIGVVTGPGDLKWLAKCPQLATIRKLNLIDSSLRSGLPDLLKSPHLANLEALRVPLHYLGNGGLAKLLASQLPMLSELDLSVGADEEMGSGRRSAAPQISSRGALELAAWPGLARLHTLDLSGAKLGVDGLLGLLSSPHTKALTALRIRNIKDSDWDMDDSLTAFRAGPAGTLDELDLTDNDIDREAAQWMADCKALRELKALRIDGVRSNHFDVLAKASWVRSLRVLSCGEPALPSILRRAPDKLHTLRITASAAPLSKAVEHLVANPPPALRRLDLSGSRVDDGGLAWLGAARLPSLSAVSLPHNRSTFTLAAVKAFANSPLGAALTSLDAGVAELDRLPAPPSTDVGRGIYRGALRSL